jgi:hypothetical protein
MRPINPRKPSPVRQNHLSSKSNRTRLALWRKRLEIAAILTLQHYILLRHIPGHRQVAIADYNCSLVQIINTKVPRIVNASDGANELRFRRLSAECPLAGDILFVPLVPGKCPHIAGAESTVRAAWLVYCGNAPALVRA